MIKLASRVWIPLPLFKLNFKIQQANMSTRIPQSFDYFLVLDFEATCDNKKKIEPQEIIEFPVLKVNAETYEVESVFHHFVKPRYHPTLTNFCMNLTSITQTEVDDGELFPVVLQEFDKWMKEDVGLGKQFLFITCGDWDLKTMLPSQCALENLQVPQYCKKWLNIKKSYAVMTGEYNKGMISMMRGLQLSHTGHLHRGFDDCLNIAIILRALANRGCKFLPTMSIS